MGEAQNRVYLDNTCFNFLNFVRDYSIFEQIEGSDNYWDTEGNGHEIVVHPKKLPKGIKIRLFNGERHVLTRKNSYGDDLEYVTARELGRLKINGKDNTYYNKKNKAIMAYIRTLPSKEIIILDWD